MTEHAAPIEHIAFLVPDLEHAIERWSRITGYTFSPVARYRTGHFLACGADAPCDSDVRLVVSREAAPRVELIEVTGDGMYGPDQVGLHHIGFRASGDEVEAQIALLSEVGVGADARITDPEGALLTWFGSKGDFDGVRLEYITPAPAPLVQDDGSPIPIDPATGRPNPWRSTGG